MQHASAGPAWESAVRRGDWRTAWAINDAVLVSRGGPPDDPRLPYHLRWVWTGRAPDARDVLVRCYHGLGDTLQFARYLMPLRARAASVTLEVQPELLALLRGVPGADRLVPFDVAHPAPASECDIEIMELPHVLRLAPEEVGPARICPGIIPEHRPCREGAFAGMSIGVCAAGGGWDPDRSVPLAALRAATAPHRAICLQRDQGDVGNWLNPGDMLPDITHTARLVLTADLVITVDTMIAHLAGTLGQPTWLLLKREADWRWMEGRADSPWYPAMRLYRQAVAGDWRAPLDAIAQDLVAVRARTRGLESTSPAIGGRA